LDELVLPPQSFDPAVKLLISALWMPIDRVVLMARLMALWQAFSL